MPASTRSFNPGMAIYGLQRRAERPRFDGFGFKILNHKSEPAFASDDVSAIAQDATGSLWFGTADGLIEYRGTSLRRFDERDGLPSSTIIALSVGSDGLLVLTSRGLVRAQGERFVPAGPPGVNIFALENSRDGDTWLLTSAGVLKDSHGDVKSWPAPVSAPNGTVLGVQTGLSGAVWIRSAGAVIARGGGAARVLRVGKDLPGTRTTALFVDQNGAAWIGTNRGLSSLNPVPDAIPEASQFLQDESVLSITEDREGNLWIGTETSGLHVLRPRKFRSEPAAAGEAVTTGTAASDGTVWYGIRKEGLRSIVHSRELRQNMAGQPVPNSSLTSPVILSMAPGRRGEIWVGTPDGLNRVTGRRVQQYTSSNGLPDDFVRSVLVDSQGSVWAGTRQGLVRIDAETPGGKITTYTEADGLGGNSIGPLLEATPGLRNQAETISSASSTDIWIGTSAGLSHFSRNRLENFSPQKSAAGNVVTAIVQDGGGNLWVALHGGGLTRFANGRFHLVPSSALPAEIVSLAVDQQGYLWLRGVQGVFRVALSAINACANDLKNCGFPVAHYGVSEGLPSAALAAEGSPAMWLGPGRELWIATRKGIAVADPAHLPMNLVPPPVVLQRLSVDGSDVPLGEGDVRIGPGHKRYAFNYAALSYTLPSGVRYRYMLEGFDRDWVEAGSQRTAFYTSLSPRTYRFRVQAENEDGIWSESDAELRVQILPPIYRRWWFYGLLLFLTGGVGWSLYRLRLRTVQRRFALVLNERNRVAREIHDTLAQDFVSVSLQLDLAAHMLKAKEFEQARTQLQTTRTMVKEGLESARQSIWNLRADATDDNLPARLTALVKRYSVATPSPRLKMGGAFRKLPSDVEDAVFRVAQESLANSSRHAEATEISLILHYDSAALRLTVEDNGRGFLLNEGRSRQGHYGLRGMEERAALLGATLTIESNHEAGTRVTLLLPLGPEKEGVR